MDKGRGDLCCTTVSFDLWTIDLPRPPNHKILLDAGDSAAFSSIFLASSFSCSRPLPIPPQRQYPAESVRGLRKPLVLAAEGNEKHEIHIRYYTSNIIIIASRYCKRGL